MNDITILHRWAVCNICGTRYHVEDLFDGIRRVKINGKYTNRCISFHKQSDPPDLQIENTIRFHNREEEKSVRRDDWY